MQRHFDLELDDLKQKLLRMGAAVEDQIQTALRALIDRDSALAQRVIENDLRVNTFDVQIDEDSLRLLALHQPTAKDLRFITTAMKISTELEQRFDEGERPISRRFCKTFHGRKSASFRRRVTLPIFSGE